jgi:hypothetical protein
MRQMWRTAIHGALLGLSLISTVFPTAASACAVCGGAADNGYLWGMLFLLSMPFTVGSLVGGWLLYSYHQAQADPATSTPTLTAGQRTPRPDSVSSRPPTLPSPSRGDSSGGGELTVRSVQVHHTLSAGQPRGVG